MKTKKGEIVWQILGLVGVTGLVVGGALCPGLLILLRPLADKRYSYKACYYSFHAMDKRGWIVAEKRSNGYRLRLTARGLAELQAYELGKKRLKTHGRWDGKWHLLIFDIEEQRRRLRDAVRGALKNFGFQRLQDSVWVYPFECQEILDLLKIRYGVRGRALYVRADKIENDRWLRRHFKLH